MQASSSIVTGSDPALDRMEAVPGAPVLPVGVLARTAIPILARCGDRPSTRVTLRSGEVPPIAPAERADFSNPRGRAARRHGPPDGYAERLGPILGKIAAAAREILYFSREPESE